MQRALTEIEFNVIDSIVKLLLEGLAETWRTIAELDFQIQGRETRPQMLQVVGRNEIVVVLAFDLTVGDIRGVVHFCVPASVVEAGASGLVSGTQQSGRAASPLEQRWLGAAAGAPVLK